MVITSEGMWRVDWRVDRQLNRRRKIWGSLMDRQNVDGLVDGMTETSCYLISANHPTLDSYIRCFNYATSLW